MIPGGRDYTSGYQSQGQGRGYPSYSSRAGQGGHYPGHRAYSQGPSYHRQQYSGAGRSDTYTGYSGSYTDRPRGGGPYTRQARSAFPGRHSQGYPGRSSGEDTGVSYGPRPDYQMPGGNEDGSSKRGQFRGRGRGGQMRPRSQSQGNPLHTTSRVSASSGGDSGFYGRRDYNSSDPGQQELAGGSGDRGHGDRGGHRGRGRGRGGGRGAGRGMGRGRGGGGRGNGRGRGGMRNSRGVYTKSFQDYKSRVEITNLPQDTTMKELRASLKEIPLDPKLHIQYLHETKAAVKILEDFEDVVYKLKEMKVGEKLVEISEGELRKPSVLIKFVSSANVDSKVLEKCLKKIELKPRLILNGGRDPYPTFSTLGCGNVKEAKEKMKELKIPGIEVGGIKTAPNKLVVKLAPKAGHLRLENIPEDCDSKKLKIKLKQKLGFELHVGKIEGGIVDVRYTPKLMVVLEKLDGLTIGEKEVKVKEVDDGEDDCSSQLNDDPMKFALPKNLTKKKFDKILGKSLPSEIQLGKESFTLKFNVPSNVIKNVKKFVDDSTAMIESGRDQSTDSEVNNNPEGDSKEENLEVKAVFGSTDIRYREENIEKVSNCSQDVVGGEKMKPSGEIA